MAFNGDKIEPTQHALARKKLMAGAAVGLLIGAVAMMVFKAHEATRHPYCCVTQSKNGTSPNITGIPCNRCASPPCICQIAD